jgi:hypothetical protein
MAFVVIVCSKCKWARGAKASAKRVKCTRCGATIDVGLAKPFAYADNELDLAKAVGDVNEGLHKRTKGSRPKPAPVAGPPRPKFKGEREAVLDLAKEKGEVTLAEIVEAIAASRGIPVGNVDKDAVSRAIEDLLMAGDLFECSIGRFRIV